MIIIYVVYGNKYTRYNVKYQRFIVLIICLVKLFGQKKKTGIIFHIFVLIIYIFLLIWWTKALFVASALAMLSKSVNWNGILGFRLKKFITQETLVNFTHQIWWLWTEFVEGLVLYCVKFYGFTGISSFMISFSCYRWVIKFPSA